MRDQVAHSRVIIASLLLAAVAFSAPVLAATVPFEFGTLSVGSTGSLNLTPNTVIQRDRALAPHPGADGPTGDDGDNDDDAQGDSDDDSEDDADDGADDDSEDDSEDDAEDEAEDDADDGAEDDAEDGTDDDAAAAAPQIVPMNWNGGGDDDWTDWTHYDWNISVDAGNFSWHGINCSWEAFSFNLSAGDNPILLLNMTCTLWDIVTIVIANGTINVSWSSGSWDHAFMPPAPAAPLQAPLTAPALAPTASTPSVAKPSAITWHSAW